MDSIGAGEFGKALVWSGVLVAVPALSIAMQFVDLHRPWPIHFG